jgi:hypothetical protein
MAAIPALLVPAVAGTATAEAAKRKSPVVTSIAPKSVSVGETLTIRGRYFRAGRGKNTVAFKRDGGRAVFVKADLGTRKLLKVKLPKRLEGALRVRNGLPAPTRLRIRVLSTRFGKSFTAVKRSPMVGPEKPATPPTPSSASATGDCDGDGVLNGVQPDDDSDLLSDTLEATLKTDPCKTDTDGDGVEDGYEYKSAIDLNDDDYQNPNQSLPYPSKRPYPNPLDATDANVDYDGDSLTTLEEQALWRYTMENGAAPSLFPLTYSAGEKYSLVTRDGANRRTPTQAAGGYAKWNAFLTWAARDEVDDVDDVGYLNVVIPHRGVVDIRDTNLDGHVEPGAGSIGGGFFAASEATPYDLDQSDAGARFHGYLSDDERDEDADGLTNYDETHGRMTAGWWDACYSAEAPYPVKYAGTSPTVPDSDGDGVLDGADDQDHDDVPNMMELSRNAASGFVDWAAMTCKKKDTAVKHGSAYGRTNPFNPCLPYTDSRTCTQHPGLNGASAPFDGSDNWYALN